VVWSKLDDNWHTDPAWEAIPPAKRLEAQAFFLHCISYCSQHLTDGRLPKSLPVNNFTSARKRRSLAVQLELVGFLRTVRDEPGYEIPMFLKWNPSKAQITQTRENEREKKARWRAKKAQSTVDSPVVSTVNRAKPSQAKPIPSQTDQVVAGRSREPVVELRPLDDSAQLARWAFDAYRKRYLKTYPDILELHMSQHYQHHLDIARAARCHREPEKALTRALDHYFASEKAREWNHHPKALAGTFDNYAKPDGGATDEDRALLKRMGLL